MRSPLVVDVLREQLQDVLRWSHHTHPTPRWGFVIHRRSERGRQRFGVVTAGGESLLLSAAMIESLHTLPCWLDGTVPVRLDARELSPVNPWLDAAGRGGRPQIVEAMAVYLDQTIARQRPDRTDKPMAGVLTPATIPSELFVLTRRRPEAWPL